MKKILVSVIFSSLVILLTGSAWAHSDAVAKKGTHGGQMVAVGPYHFELLAKDGELRLYVTDQNNREHILTKGGSAKANVIDKDGKKVSVRLIPIFANFMKGTGDFKITPETVISVFVVPEQNKTYAARFTSLVQGASASSAQKEEVHEHHHVENTESESTADEHEHEHESSTESGEGDSE